LWSSPGGRALLIFLLTALIGGILCGFMLAARDARQFAISLLAELVGTAFSFLLALLVIDWLLEQRKKTEWRKIGEMTLRAIAEHICEIAGALFQYFGELDYQAMDPIFRGHIDPPNERTLKALGGLLKALDNYEQPLAEALEKSPSDIAVKYYEYITWDLEQIRTVLTPRVLTGPKDQELVELLIRFDQEYRELQHAVIAHREVSTQSVFPQHVVALIEAAKDCYGAILYRFKGFSET